MNLHTLIEAFRAFLERQDYRQMTLVGYLEDVQQFYTFLKAQLGREPEIGDLTPEGCKAYLAAQAQRYRRSTLMRRLASLRSFQRFLRTEGHLEVDFVPSTKEVAELLEQARESQEIVCFDSDELRQIWESMLRAGTPRAIRDLAIIALFVEWGLPSEWLIRFRADDVNLEHRRLRIPDLVEGAMWVPIRAAHEPLRRYLAIRDRFNPTSDEHTLFLSQLGRPISRQSLWQSLRSWGDILRLRKSLTPQVLRNTAAYRLAQSQVPADMLQIVFGHTNPLSTRFLLRRLQRACQSTQAVQLPILQPTGEIVMGPGAEAWLPEDLTELRTPAGRGEDDKAEEGEDSKEG